MSRLIESIRLKDGKWYNLEYHQERIYQSVRTLFDSKPSWVLSDLLERQQVPAHGLFKCRIVYDLDATSVDIAPYTIRPVTSLRIVEDNEIEYDHKFEDRGRLNALFEKREGRDDILIVHRGKITDSSYANLLFLRDGQWFTPSTFLLNGTMRRCLLDEGKIKEQSIAVDDLSKYEKFKLTNAMLELNAPGSDVSNIN